MRLGAASVPGFESDPDGETTIVRPPAGGNVVVVVGGVDVVVVVDVVDVDVVVVGGVVVVVAGGVVVGGVVVVATVVVGRTVVDANEVVVGNRVVVENRVVVGATVIGGSDGGTEVVASAADPRDGTPFEVLIAVSAAGDGGGVIGSTGPNASTGTTGTTATTAMAGRDETRGVAPVDVGAATSSIGSAGPALTESCGGISGPMAGLSSTGTATLTGRGMDGAAEPTVETAVARATFGLVRGRLCTHCNRFTRMDRVVPFFARTVRRTSTTFFLPTR